jgi:S-adenosylmethionine:diacylglycerol 3-amino-3-carboxypropyl transferase
MAVEFNGVRGKSYKAAILEYPNLWDEDEKVMYDHLAPKTGERIVEIGAGSGFILKKFLMQLDKMVFFTL